MLKDGSTTQLAVRCFLDSTEFDMLDAASNTIKHYSVIEAPFFVSFLDERRHGLRMASFAYAGRQYEARWAGDFLHSTWDSLLPLIIGILCAAEQDAQLNAGSTLARSEL